LNQTGSFGLAISIAPTDKSRFGPPIMGAEIRLAPSVDERFEAKVSWKRFWRCSFD